jgi:hypothetical protein
MFYGFTILNLMAQHNTFNPINHSVTFENSKYPGQSTDENSLGGSCYGISQVNSLLGAVAKDGGPLWFIEICVYDESDEEITAKIKLILEKKARPSLHRICGFKNLSEFSQKKKELLEKICHDRQKKYHDESLAHNGTGSKTEQEAKVKSGTFIEELISNLQNKRQVITVVLEEPSSPGVKYSHALTANYIIKSDSNTYRINVSDPGLPGTTQEMVLHRGSDKVTLYQGKTAISGQLASPSPY